MITCTVSDVLHALEARVMLQASIRQELPEGGSMFTCTRFPRLDMMIQILNCSLKATPKRVQLRNLYI